MKRTLFPKLLAGYLLYGILGFLIIATFTYHLTFRFLERHEAAALYRESALISSVYAENYFSKTMTLEEIRTQLTTLGIYLSGEIWIVDTKGSIILNTAQPEPAEKMETIPGFDVTDFGSSYFQTGRFYNCFPSDTLSVFSPVTVSYKVRGYVIIHKPVSSLISFANSLTAISYQTLALLFASAFLVLVFFAFVVYLPIRKITRAASQYASGNFEADVDVRSSDEIGYLAASLSYMANELNTLEEDQKKFVSNVSHELKTPLTSMKVLADSLNGQENVPVELYKEFMADIGNEIDRETKIINDLLSLVKMNRSAVDLNIASVNINELLELILKRLRPIAARQHIELVLESFRPVSAEVDEVKLTLAFTNLVENGIKYNKKEGWVHVTLNADHQYFYVKVEDSGIGIPEDALEHIYERFYRVDKSHSREIGGTGLGLAITRSSILMHRGAIKVFSIEGEGTVFNVRIPLNYIIAS